MNFDPYLMLYTKLNSYCTIDLYLRAKTIKLLEGNIGLFRHLQIMYLIRVQYPKYIKDYYS